MRLPLIAAILLAAASTPAFALKILVVNDDGLTSNLKALHAALKNAGHDVIVSVPCTGQSGRGAAVVMYSSGRIVADNDKTQIDAEAGCHNGAAPLGAPAVGPFTKAGFTNGDFYYAHGTPVAATMYGLDVLAPQRWKAPPDLVLSGPNEGQNLGRLVNSSGTVGNAQFAAARGLPSIALSAASQSRDDRELNNPQSPIIAALTLKLVAALQASAGRGPLLPAGIALNVNFPDTPRTDLGWALTRHGTTDPYEIHFNDTPPYGPRFARVDVQPSAAQAQDEGVVYRTKITVTPMQQGFDVASATSAALGTKLRALLAPAAKTAASSTP